MPDPIDVEGSGRITLAEFTTLLQAGEARVHELYSIVFRTNQTTKLNGWDKLGVSGEEFHQEVSDALGVIDNIIDEAITNKTFADHALIDSGAWDNDIDVPYDESDPPVDNSVYGSEEAFIEACLNEEADWGVVGPAIPKYKTYDRLWELTGLPGGLRRAMRRRVNGNLATLANRTTDTEGNTIAVGHIAQNSNKALGTMHIRCTVAGGAGSMEWEAHPGPADILTSDEDAPFHARPQDFVTPGVGRTEPGDFVGRWLIEDRKAVLDLLQRTGGNVAYLDGAWRFGRASAPSAAPASITEAELYTLAKGAWDDSAGGGSGSSSTTFNGKSVSLTWDSGSSFAGTGSPPCRVQIRQKTTSILDYSCDIWTLEASGDVDEIGTHAPAKSYQTLGGGYVGRAYKAYWRNARLFNVNDYIGAHEKIEGDDFGATSADWPLYTFIEGSSVSTAAVFSWSTSLDFDVPSAPPALPGSFSGSNLRYVQAVALPQPQIIIEWDLSAWSLA